MDKLPMCRICLVQNVRMFVVFNRNLRDLYEKLTDIPFVTEDRRPMFACFFCFAKLKQCYGLLRQCLKAEELFARKMNEDYETNPLINQDHFKFYSGFIISPLVHISIVGAGQTESIDIKEETPAVCEGLDDVIESKEEYQSEELELKNLDSSSLDEADIPPQHSESDSEDDVPLIELQTEMEEEQEGYKTKQNARGRKSAAFAKKPKLDTRRTKLDALTTEGTKNDKSDSKVIRTTRKRSSKPGTCFKEPNKCDQRSVNQVKKNIQQRRTQIGEKPYKCDVCQRSFTHNCHLTKHVRIHTGEKPFKCDVCQRSFVEKGALNKHNRIHTGEKPYKCDSCELSFTQKSALINHIRRHTGEKPYKCDVCHHSFRDKGALANHNRTHTGKKPYTCDLCQHSFRDKVALTNHYRIHTGEKPFKCEICECSFRQNGHLTSHMRNHTGEKPFKCDICLCNFRQIGHLTNHIIRVHAGEKPFKRF